MRYFLILVLFIFSFNLKAEDLREKLSFLYNQGKYEEAISLCKEKLKVSKDKFYYLNLALLYEEKGDVFSGLSVLKEALPFYKEDKDIIFQLARFYFLTSNQKDSIRFFKKYLSLAPQDKRAYFYLGLNYEDLKKFNQAERFYRKALEIDPYFNLVLFKLSELYFKEGKDSKAVNILKELKQLEPSIKSVYKKLALLYFKQGKFLLSFKEASKFLEMVPSDREVQLVLKSSKKKLGKEFFRKEAEKLALARKKKKAQVSSFVKGNIPRVRVCIAEKLKNFEFKLTEKAFLYKGDLAIFKLDKNTLYKISLTPQGLLKLSDDKGRVVSKELEPPLIIKSESPYFLIGVFGLNYAQGKYWSKNLDTFFRGSLFINTKDKSLYLVNILNLEEYLYGVLPSEVSSNWPESALSAQAVVARTKALEGLGRKNRDYDFSNTYSFQVYLGASKENKATNSAVDKTRGLVLVDKEGLPLNVYYCSNCGGHTREGKEYRGVLDSDKDIKKFPLTPFEFYEWVTGEPEVFCKTRGVLKSRFRWQRFYPQKKFLENLSRIFNLGRIKKIEILERDVSSHICKLKISGENGYRIIDSEFKIREVLDGLRSTLFWIERKSSSEDNNSYFLIWGGGFGHGKGLCQFGAKGMAEKGYSYLEILQHYFPDSSLKKLY